MARTRRSWGSLRQLPSGRWQAKYPDPDRAGKLTPAPSTFATKGAGDRWLSRKRSEIDSGQFTDEKAGNRPLSDWWPGYYATTSGLKVRTRTAYETAWRLRIESTFGSRPVRRIKPNDIDDWITDMESAGVSASKVIEAVGVLGRVLDRVARDRAIPENPMKHRGRRLPKRPVTDHPVLTPAEVEKLCDKIKRDADKILVRTLAYSGVRIGEAFALKWSCVDLERKVMRICESSEDNNGTLVVGPTKTYATRTITLPDALCTWLEQLPRTSSLVFPNRSGTYKRYRNWRRDVWDPAAGTWNDDTERWGNLIATPHDLRATCASLLIDAGASPKDVQVHLGHEDIATTMNLYARVRPGRNVDIASRLDALIAEAS